VQPMAAEAEAGVTAALATSASVATTPTTIIDRTVRAHRRPRCAGACPTGIGADEPLS
jgi:hypothetical protein